MQSRALQRLDITQVKRVILKRFSEHTSVQAVSKPKLVSTIMRSLSTVQGTATLEFDGGAVF